MKKLLSVVLCTLLVLTMAFSTNILAENDIKVEIDGKTVEFDVNPEIIEGRTMVPLRKIFEEIGALVKWNNDTKTVSARKNSKTITLVIDSENLQIDKGKTDDEGNPIIETIKLEVPAKIISGRTMVPARAISESFGLDVNWDEENKKVVIVSDDEEDDTWKENTGTINLTELTYEGKGVEIVDNHIKITEGGDFTVTGTLEDGNITISAKEKVKLRLSGAKITSSSNPCIFVEKADKAYITLTDETENYLVAENSEDGAIYSKENLEIKGDGSLDIKSLQGHGMKASDNLNIENGKITIDATSDGIHINDTFKMTGGEINITSVNDGIDCESIINISKGTINVETTATPIEKAEEKTKAEETAPKRGMWGEDEADVEFEKSTKGINAEWMLLISGGEINVNSASHAIHCQDEIEINGGKFTLSSKYDKGISAHGNLTINGSETTIDVLKSTEGIESKNVMTINDGIIKVLSTDDAINATGGNSGMMMPGGNFGGNGEGAENMPPEGFGRWHRPQNNQTNTNGETETKEKTTPQRDKNDWFANMPPFERNENGEIVPPPEMPPREGGFSSEVGERPQMDISNMPQGFMGGNRRNMKSCLIINGGYLELCGNDDCIDTNGNMVINGGTVKAANPSGSFTGNFGVLDADGQITISENANVFLASSSGNERGLTLSQNTVIVYCANNHEADEKITVADKDGNVIYEFVPNGSFKAVLIASPDIISGEKYKITVGTEIFEAEIAQQSTIVGEQSSGNMGFGRWQRPQ